jgi:hypothetical protein
VVFFDEVERIERFSFKARLGAYQELGWWKRTCKEANSAIFAVFSETSAAVEQCLEDKGDRDRVRSGGSLLPEERDQLALDGMELFDSVVRLRPATIEQLETLQHGVRDLYGRAYSSQPSSVTIRKDYTTVRSEIRRWITIWDLQRHYPSYSPNVESEEVVMDTADIADEELANDDGDGGA